MDAVVEVNLPPMQLVKFPRRKPLPLPGEGL